MPINARPSLIKALICFTAVAIAPNAFGAPTECIGRALKDYKQDSELYRLKFVECFSEAYLQKDFLGNSLGVPGIYDALIGASAYSVTMKQELRGGLKSVRSVQDVMKLFAQVCAKLKTDTQLLGVGSAQMIALCEDDIAGKSSLQREFHENLLECENEYATHYQSTHDELFHGENPCVEAARQNLLTLTDRMDTAGTPQASGVHGFLRTLKTGGYTDGTLDKTDRRYDPRITECKNLASTDEDLKLKARVATQCVFESPVFESVNQTRMAEITDFFNGQEPHLARNSAVQTFLMQVRGAAVQLAAQAIQNEQAALGESSPIEVPASCEAVKAGDHGFFEQIITSAKTPKRDSKNGARHLVEAALLAESLQKKLSDLDSQCDAIKMSRAITQGRGSAPRVGDPCAGLVEEAQLDRAALDSLVSRQPALLFGIHRDHSRSYSSLGGIRVLDLPALGQILRVKEQGEAEEQQRLKQATELRRAQLIFMKKALGSLCDAKTTPTIELLQMQNLVQPLMKVAKSDLLSRFMTCVQTQHTPSMTDVFADVIGQMSVCVGASVATGAVATPFVGAAVGLGCGIGLSLSDQLPEYWDSVAETQRRLREFQMGILNESSKVDEAIERMNSRLQGLVMTGALTAGDVGTLVVAARAARSAARLAEASATASDVEAAKEGERLRSKFGYQAKKISAATEQRSVRLPLVEGLPSKMMVRDVRLLELDSQLAGQIKQGKKYSYVLDLNDRIHIIEGEVNWPEGELMAVKTLGANGKPEAIWVKQGGRLEFDPSTRRFELKPNNHSIDIAPEEIEAAVSHIESEHPNIRFNPGTGGRGVATSRLIRCQALKAAQESGKSIILGNLRASNLVTISGVVVGGLLGNIENTPSGRNYVGASLLGSNIGAIVGSIAQVAADKFELGFWPAAGLYSVSGFGVVKVQDQLNLLFMGKEGKKTARDLEKFNQNYFVFRTTEGVALNWFLLNKLPALLLDSCLKGGPEGDRLRVLLSPNAIRIYDRYASSFIYISTAPISKTEKSSNH
ncbi:hypothetical protein WDW37_11040 [Bdellovibrionota bacterium FG-1]